MNNSSNYTDSLHREAYLRARMNPQLGEPVYLHLSDIRLALEKYKTDLPLKILDFGSGGAPYRSLFPQAHYQCADTSAAQGIDYVISANGTIDAASQSFDLVLSTQVLEHVPSPEAYLAECKRLCKSGGKLLLTTHGVWEDHPCPDDFWRWTSSGLERTIQSAGFRICETRKITTNGRMIASLIEGRQGFFPASRKTFAGIAWWLLYRLLVQRPIAFHKWCDSFFPSCRVVEVATPGHDLYLGILVEAESML